jgi:putative addiction module CopG family antidote
LLTTYLSTPNFDAVKTLTLNISLTPHYNAIIRRFLKTGLYQSDSEVIRAALQRLAETEWNPNAYPPGSVRHLYSARRNREERALNKVSTLRVDHDE